MSSFQNSGVTLFKNTNLTDDIKQIEAVKIPVKRFQIRVNTTVGFERANWQVACQNKRSRQNRYHKGQQISFGVDLQHFKAYGPGIYLFFKFMKQITIVFFIMTIISLIPIIYNYFVGTNLDNVSDSFQVYLARLSIANQQGVSSSLATSADVQTSLRHKLVNIIPDMLNAIVLFVFYLYWDKKSQKLVNEVKKEIKLPNQTTVEILSFPQEANQKDIQNYMSRFGVVRQVASVRNFQETIALSKKIYELSLVHKQLRLLNNSQQPTQKMKEVQQKISQLYKQLEQFQKQSKHQEIKFYVQFDNSTARDQVVQAFKPHNDLIKCCRAQPDQKFYLNGQICQVIGCDQQPGGIIWENVHITWATRWMRYLIQIILLIAIIAAGFLFISFLNITTPPVSNDSLDTSSYNQTTILTATDKGIIQSWCLKNNYTLIATKALCDTYVYQYYMKTAISVAISLAAVVIKFIMRIVVRALAHFQRYKTHTEQSNDIIINLFVLYTVTTIVIIFLLQADVFRISFKSILGGMITNQYLKTNLNLIIEYQDFSPAWYMDIGYQILFTWIIVALSPHTFYGFIHWILQKIRQWRAKSQILQKNMQQKMQAEEFEIQDHYANILMILFVTMMFSGGMPLMVPISFIAFFTRYLYYKHSFIRFCRVPKAFNQALNKKVSRVLPICVLVHFGFTFWMYGVSQIFAFQPNWMTAMINSNSYGDIAKGFSQVLNRVSNTWYLLIIFGAMLLILIFKTIFFDLIGKCCCNSGQQTNLKQIKDQQQIFQRSQKSLTNSYKLQNNPDYFQILAIMNPKTVRVIQNKT